METNPNVGKEKETRILLYFNSIDSDNFFIEHAVENTWNSTYRNIFDDFGYRYCLVHIKKDPNLLHKMSGIGALAPQLIANYESKVVSVFGRTSRHWFLPVSFFHQPKMPSALDVSMFLGHIPILQRKLHVNTYKALDTVNNKKHIVDDVLYVHFFCQVCLDNIICN